jgi:hypothetical protein
MHYELFKSMFLQEWFVAWFLTAELLVLYHTFVVAAFLQAVLSELSSQLLVEQVA